MVALLEYGQDGAGSAARAVLAYLQGMSAGCIEESWDDEFKRYKAQPRIGRWENCREQGYIVHMRNAKGVQLNIAWFEHRNSDEICALKWPQNTINSPTIDTAEFELGDIYKDKYDVSHTVPGEQGRVMAEWIADALKAHWGAE